MRKCGKYTSILSRMMENLRRMQGIRGERRDVSKSRRRRGFHASLLLSLQRSPVEKRSGSLLLAMPLNVAHVATSRASSIQVERARVFYANVDLRERLSYARLTMSSFRDTVARYSLR